MIYVSISTITTHNENEQLKDVFVVIKATSSYSFKGKPKYKYLCCDFLYLL